MTTTDRLKKKMVAALEKSLGIVTSACKSVDISRETHYKWLRSDTEYRRACKEIENVALDFVETQLHKQIAKGNSISTIFYLKCKGKKRGYIEDHTIEIKGNMKFKADFGTSNLVQSASEPIEVTYLDQSGTV